MGMRQQDQPHVNVEVTHCRHQLIRLVTRIDDDGFARSFTPHDESIFVERRNRADFNDHATTILLRYCSLVLRPSAQALREKFAAPIGNDVASAPTQASPGVNMVVCVVDDLIFSIKISTAARQLGVPMYFERLKQNVLQTIRDKQPSLVIFDLNSGRLAPIETIALMKNDPALQAIRTLGYVAHVDSETIDKARAAGIDQVLARSAFSDRLREHLKRARATDH